MTGAAWGALSRAWAFLRAASGDSAWEEHVRRGGRLTPEQLWLDRLRRRYDSPSRCC